MNIPDHPVIRNMENTGYPNGKSPRLRHYCFECDAEIYEGDTYYSILGHPFCKDCIKGFKKEA